MGHRHAERVARACDGYTGVLDKPEPEDDLIAPWRDWPRAALTDSEVGPLRVRIVSLPNLPPTGDVVDWFEAGHTADELRDLIETTPVWSAGRWA